MPLLNSDDQQLAKEEFSRDRDNLTSIYLSQTTSLLDGARGVSDKQFNLNIALASISAAIIGIVIPVVVTSTFSINEPLFWTAIIVMGSSLIINLIVSFGAIYYDAWTLGKQRVKINNYFRELLDSTSSIINNAKNNMLTDEHIETHYARKNELNTTFAISEGQWAQKLLNFGYYIYITLFLFGLILIVFTFSNIRKRTSKIYIL